MSTEDWIRTLRLIGFFLLWVGVGVGISFGITPVVKKHPKLYAVFNLPVTLYPYAYMISLIILFIISKLIDDGYNVPEFLFIVTNPIALALIIHPLVLASLIMDFRVAKIMNYKKQATLSMVNKLVHIPAFVFHFILGLFGSLASVWGIGFVLFAVTVDLMTIIISGTFSLASNIGLYKQKQLSLPVTVVAAVTSYIYCVDVISVVAVKLITLGEVGKNKPQGENVGG